MANNNCCHFCRMSKNRTRKHGPLVYVNCNTCQNVYCQNCVESYLKQDVNTLKKDKDWQCDPCKGICCCKKTECAEDHRHCFTYTRTKKRHNKQKLLRGEQVEEVDFSKHVRRGRPPNKSRALAKVAEAAHCAQNEVSSIAMNAERKKKTLKLAKPTTTPFTSSSSTSLGVGFIIDASCVPKPPDLTSVVLAASEEEKSRTDSEIVCGTDAERAINYDARTQHVEGDEDDSIDDSFADKTDKAYKGSISRHCASTRYKTRSQRRVEAAVQALVSSSSSGTFGAFQETDVSSTESCDSSLYNGSKRRGGSVSDDETKTFVDITAQYPAPAVQSHPEAKDSQAGTTDNIAGGTATNVEEKDPIISTPLVLTPTITPTNSDLNLFGSSQIMPEPLVRYNSFSSKLQPSRSFLLPRGSSFQRSYDGSDQRSETMRFPRPDSPDLFTSSTPPSSQVCLNRGLSGTLLDPQVQWSRTNSDLDVWATPV